MRRDTANTNALIDDGNAIDAKYKYFAYGEVSAMSLGVELVDRVVLNVGEEVGIAGGVRGYSVE